MITEIVKSNNRSLFIDDKELKEYITYGANWVNITYKNGMQQFIPNCQIQAIFRYKRRMK